MGDFSKQINAIGFTLMTGASVLGLMGCSSTQVIPLDVEAATTTSVKPEDKPPIADEFITLVTKAIVENVATLPIATEISKTLDAPEFITTPAPPKHEYTPQPNNKPEAWKGMEVEPGLPPLTTENYNPTTGELNTHLSKAQAKIINAALWNIIGDKCFEHKPESIQLSNAIFKDSIAYNNSTYVEMLAKHEQSRYLENKFHSCNKLAYAGKWQIGTDAMMDTGLYEKRMDSHVMWDGKWTQKAKDHGIHNIYDFLNSEPMQEWAIREYTQNNLNILSKLGAMYYATKHYTIIGQQGVSDSFNAGFEEIKISEAGLAAAAHNIGAKTLHRAIGYGEPNKKTKEVHYAIITKKGGTDANGSSGLGYLEDGQDIILFVSKRTKINPKNGRHYTHFSGMSMQLPSLTKQDDRWEDKQATPIGIAEKPQSKAVEATLSI